MKVFNIKFLFKVLKKQKRYKHNKTSNINYNIINNNRVHTNFKKKNNKKNYHLYRFTLCR